jgi:predicted O-methyltransferase YrrM
MLSEPETRALQRYAAGCDRVLEVGTNNGYSAISMAHAGACVLCVDQQADWTQFHGWTRREGVASRVLAWPIAFQDVAPAASVFDLVFIDATHTEEHIRHDVPKALLMLRRPGLLVCHDWDGHLTYPDIEEGYTTALREMLGEPHELTGMLAMWDVEPG